MISRATTNVRKVSQTSGIISPSATRNVRTDGATRRVVEEVHDPTKQVRI